MIDKQWMWGAALVAATVLTSGARAETWDLPAAYPDTNFHTENLKAFAAEVTDKTGGAVTIVVHGNGSLFKGNDIKRAVQTGQAPIGERLMSAHANENAVFGFDSVPFLATDFGASAKLWAAAQPVMARLLDEQNLVLLYAVPWPPQGLYTRKDINALADMQGVKFRSYNTATARIAELAGAVPVQIEAAELSQALATGVVESFVSSGSTGYDSKVWEQLTHFYEVNAWLPRNYVFANKDAWNALDDATRQAIEAAADAAEARGTAKAEELTTWYLQQLAANGMKVQQPAEALKADLAKVGATMTAEWSEAAGADGRTIIDSYKAQ